MRLLLAAAAATLLLAPSAAAAPPTLVVSAEVPAHRDRVGLRRERDCERCKSSWDVGRHGESGRPRGCGRDEQECQRGGHRQEADHESPPRVTARTSAMALKQACMRIVG